MHSHQHPRRSRLALIAILGALAAFPSVALAEPQDFRSPDTRDAATGYSGQTPRGHRPSPPRPVDQGAAPTDALVASRALTAGEPPGTVVGMEVEVLGAGDVPGARLDPSPRAALVS